MPGRATNQCGASASMPINIDEDFEHEDLEQSRTGLEHNSDDDREIDDHSQEHEQTTTRNNPQRSRRNGLIENPWIVIDSVLLRNGEIANIGDCVEISSESKDASDPTDFLQVKRILFNTEEPEQDHDPIVRLRGLKFRRSYHYRGRGLNRAWLNDVILDLEIDEDDCRDPEEQAQVEVDLDRVVKKRILTISSRPHPEDSWRTGGDAISYSRGGDNEEIIKDFIAHHAKITARFAVKRVFKTAVQRMSSKPLGGSFTRIKSLISPQHNRAAIPVQSIKKPTFLDIFCGAGGASAGARLAGYRVIAGVEKDKVKMETWEANNRGAKGYQMEVDGFIDRFASSYTGKINHLHLSPPCQPYSPNHTRPGQNDETNEAALFSILRLLEIVRPDILTLEETAGLMNRHPEFFHALISQIHEAGYDCEWKRINLAQYGVPQKSRDRLILLAIRHGEVMPRWPQPTHGGPGSGLIPWVSVQRAIRGVPRVDPLHDEVDARSIPVADLSLPLQGCICTGGPTMNYSARRQFSVREVACLQTFPLTHIFHGSRTEMLTQIGNAFPSAAAKALFLECFKVLREKASLTSSLEVIDLSEQDGNEDEETYRPTTASHSRAPMQRVATTVNLPRWNQLQDASLNRPVSSPSAPFSGMGLAHSNPILIDDE